MLFFLFLTLACSRPAAEALEDNNTYQFPEDPFVREKLDSWSDWKFGIIIHWGPYSEWGIVESWSLCPEDEPWCERRGPYAEDYATYLKAYKDIQKQFYPETFNPEGWAKAAKKAGMKYVVFTTKHHDGFSMFDTKYSDYKITGSESRFAEHPKSNVVEEVFSAFRNQGLGIGAYFSKADWHHHDYWWPYFPSLDRNVNYNPEKYPEKWQRFKDFIFNQIQELMSDYGKIDLLWLDGGWVRPAASLTEETRSWLGKNQWIQDIDMPAIAKMARQHQPGLLIVDRTVHGEFENYRTPEQQIPTTIPDYPWESCITLGDSWYSTGPNEEYKSVHWAVHTLVKIVSKGGNLLLGVGPDKTGEFVPEVYERLEEIGKWMEINDKAIYNTRPLYPYEEDKLYFTQSKDGQKSYAFYLSQEEEELPETIVLSKVFLKDAFEVRLLGFDDLLPVVTHKDHKSVNLTHSIRMKFKDCPALVFAIENQ
ncbi:MAG: alpha-L-fucosidase [Bacteroidetes bacterium HGW-Bacteroidetes-1]|nr:MAG: alpha-L-fucosidase [Bacteroidetes bacterium HGW-Bacteroidetes-1]